MGKAADIHNLEVVKTDDGGHIRAQHQEFVEVFGKETAETLPLHRPIDHAVHLDPDFKLADRLINNLSEFELSPLKAHIEMNLADRYIQRSSLSAARTILLRTQKHTGLQLCVDFLLST